VNEATAVVAPARSGSTRSAGPAPNCCCWWRSVPSCSAACPRSGQLADDLRVLPGRRAARLGHLAPGEQADQDADQRDLAGGGGALILGLPYLGNTAAYGAVTSIATIGLYVAYVTPTFLRLRQGDSFRRGPWHLGRWELRDRLDGRGLGRDHLLPVHAPAIRPDQMEHVQLRGGRRGRGDRFAGIYWLVSAKNWFTVAQGAGLGGGTGPRSSGAFRLMAADQGAGAGAGERRRGLLTMEQLRVAVGEGEVDTVVLAFTDMQGRLAGKRLSAEFFLEEWPNTTPRAATTCSPWTWT